MKKILITGVNSYVGTSLAKWLSKETDNYSIDMISLRDGTWKDRDFSIYDVVVHVAGIAHRRETKGNAALYYKVNRDLAFEVAKKAKQEFVEHFIFLSSMSVYGLDVGVIDEYTPLNPKTNYGKSKFEAENLIKPLADKNFKLAIIRPPMIYGKGCKGNYQKLSKLAKNSAVFPKLNNERSMIYIDNLTEFIKVIIEEESNGIYFPQNKEYVCTSELVEIIAQVHNKRIHMTKLLNPIIRLVKISTVNKVFGNLIYSKTVKDHESSLYNRFIELRESIKLTEE